MVDPDQLPKKASTLDWCKERWAGIAWVLTAILFMVTFTDAWSSHDLPTPATRGWTQATIGNPLLESRLDTAEDRIRWFKDKIRELEALRVEAKEKAGRAALEERLDTMKDELKKAEAWRKELLRQLKRDK